MMKFAFLAVAGLTLAACSSSTLEAGREVITNGKGGALARYATEAAADAVIGQCVAHAFKPVGAPLAMNEALVERRSWVQVDCQALRPPQQ